MAPDEVEVLPGSYHLSERPVIGGALRQGIFAARQGDGEGSLPGPVSVLQEMPDEAGCVAQCLLRFTKVTPVTLAKYCNALADCQVLLLTLRPSSGAVLLCEQQRLAEALAALLSCGCNVRLPGDSDWLPSFAARSWTAARCAGATAGAWSTAGLLRLQVAGFFLEVPFFKANEPCLFPVEVSRAGVLSTGAHYITVMAFEGQRLFEGDSQADMAKGDWTRLEDQDQFLALELQSPLRRGVWLFVGQYFARIESSDFCGGSSSARVVQSETANLEVLVGQVTRPGRLESFSATGQGSVHLDLSDAVTFQDGLCQIASGEVTQRWKVHEMTFNPFMTAVSKDPEVSRAEVPEGYSDGSKVKYWSVTVQRWIPATVVSQNKDGTYRLDVKKRAELHHLRPPEQAGDLPPPSPPAKNRAKGEKRKQKHTQDNASSKAKRKAKKQKESAKVSSDEVTSSSSSESSDEGENSSSSPSLSSVKKRKSKVKKGVKKSIKETQKKKPKVKKKKKVSSSSS